MGAVMIDIWPMLVTAILTGIGTYIGFIHKLRVKVAVLENKVEKVENEVQRVDQRVKKKSEQFDKIQEDISDIRVKLARIAAVLDIVEHKKGGE